MRERERIKTENSMKFLKDTLKELILTEQKEKISEELREIQSKFINMLVRNDISELLIEGIIELFRIVAPHNIMSNIEIDLFFEAILKLMPTKFLKLDNFIKFRIPALLKNKKIIDKFFKLLNKSIINKQYLDDILVIFIEEANNPMIYISKLLKYPVLPKYILKKVHKLIMINEITEEEYIRLYCDILCDCNNDEIRIARGKERIKFVKAAIKKNKKEIIMSYYNDRDKRIRNIIAENCDIIEIFDILINDSDEDVRKSLIFKLRWDDIFTYNIYDRILDSSYNVRQITYKLFREGLSRVRNLDIFDHDGIIKTYKNIIKNKIKMPEKENQTQFINETEINRNLDAIRKFVVKLCQGCLTNAKDEYIKILQESNFSVSFLYNIRNEKGAKIFLETIETDIIIREYADFCLEYLYNGELSNDQINMYIENNNFSVLKFIKTADDFYELLVKKIYEIKEKVIIEKILELIKSKLNEEFLVLYNQERIYFIKDKSDFINDFDKIEFYYKEYDYNKESDFWKNILEFKDLETKKNYYNLFRILLKSEKSLMINAYTQFNEIIFNEIISSYIKYKGYDFFTIEEMYSFVYFLGYKDNKNELISFIIKNFKFPIDYKLLLLLSVNNYDVLCNNANILLGCELSYDIQAKIKRNMNTNAAIIYFLSCGAVSVKSMDFFVKCLKIACFTYNETKQIRKDLLKIIFKKYVNSINQTVYDKFYTICWNLKDYIISNSILNQDGILCKNDNSINFNSKNTKLSKDIFSENARNDLKKIKLALPNKILYFICDFIISIRKGDIIDLDYDFEKHGFLKLSENIIEMIRYNQVEYH